VTSWVGEHPPATAVGLILGLACTVAEQRSLREVEVIDLEVGVGLLRLFLSGPLRRSVRRHTLKPQEEAVRAP